MQHPGGEGNAVLGGAVIIMSGLITSAGMKMLHAVPFNKRNMLIIGVSLAVAIGLRLQEASTPTPPRA